MVFIRYELWVNASVIIFLGTVDCDERFFHFMDNYGFNDSWALGITDNGEIKTQI